MQDWTDCLPGRRHVRCAASAAVSATAELHCAVSRHFLFSLNLTGLIDRLCFFMLVCQDELKGLEKDARKHVTASVKEAKKGSELEGHEMYVSLEIRPPAARARACVCV